ncbi:DNA methyltransferase, partial [Blastomonas sp.]|uniref:DNA methyltransferase n=1 Tax=Blastomonas sp. TaxID=1909299 RepID=UPI003593DCFD
GYLQWHFRTRGNVKPPIPVIRDFRNIENRDAVLAHDGMEYVLDEAGVPITRWDGETMKLSPVTGEKIPDETARKPVERYLNPRKAAWPQADFVVGNPPFIGNKRMRTALGDGYVEALRGAWLDVPETSDFVMYWWHHAAQLTGHGALLRFGFITTNSIGMTFNRRVVGAHLSDRKSPINLAFAVPDHPWVDSTDGAAVRISMTVGEKKLRAQGSTGRLAHVLDERPGEELEMSVDMAENKGLIHADLSVGANVAAAPRLKANQGVSFMGVILVGGGFIVEAGDSLVTDESGALRRYINGRDLVQTTRNVWVIDFYGLEEAEARSRFPGAYQRVHDRVLPERLQVKRESHRRDWWLFGEKRPAMREALAGLQRFIGTTETAKFRTFVFIEAQFLPDQKVRVIADDRGETLGVLSSAAHERWASATGARMGVGNDLVYNNTSCFEPFPFPVPSRNQEEQIGNLAEHLDTHRKRQQAGHPGLTLTGMYNALDKLRSGEPLTAKERVIHEQGLVSVMRQLHDDLDVAVLDAYGWSDLLPLLRVAHGNDASAEGQTRDDAKRAFDEAILERLVALNAERAAEEARGHIRWLRPEFQNPQSGVAPQQAELHTGSTEDDTPATPAPTIAQPIPWPKNTVEQVRAVADLLSASPVPLSLNEIGNSFTARGPWRKRLPQLVEMLVALGRAEMREGGVVGMGR